MPTCTSSTQAWKAAARCRLFQRLATVLATRAFSWRPCTQARNACQAAVRCRCVQHIAKLSPSCCHLRRCTIHSCQPSKLRRTSHEAANIAACWSRGSSQDTLHHSRKTTSASFRSEAWRKLDSLDAALCLR